MPQCDCAVEEGIAAEVVQLLSMLFLCRALELEGDEAIGRNIAVLLKNLFQILLTMLVTKDLL